ncbi:hypothetical protein HY480_02815 [Candidatus Uhrbacteria bacterium]|nr:hypothetical protein [Candidatus Uhrbacteria bacterium]
MFALALHGRRSRRTSSLSGMLARVQRINPRSANIAALSLLAVSMIAYLALTNENATAGYELQTLEHQLETLRDETRQLELSTLDAQSVPQLTARIAKEEFIPVARVDYITPTSRGVAAR